MTDLSERVKQLEKDAATGALGRASKSDLEKYLTVLCAPNAYREFSDRQFPTLLETVRMLLLRAHIESLQSHVVELHGHITNLNVSNTKIQKWVIVLAVAALISTTVQTVVTVMVYVNTPRVETIETTSSPSAVQPSIPIKQAPFPIQAAPSSSGRITKKTP